MLKIKRNLHAHNVKIQHNCIKNRWMHVKPRASNDFRQSCVTSKSKNKKQKERCFMLTLSEILLVCDLFYENDFGQKITKIAVNATNLLKKTYKI